MKEFLAKIVNDFQLLTTFAKSSIVDVLLGSECRSNLGVSKIQPVLFFLFSLCFWPVEKRYEYFKHDLLPFFLTLYTIYETNHRTDEFSKARNTEKWHFRRFTTFAFDVKVASKPSNLKSFDFLPHFPHLPHLVAEKFAQQ